jgi:hypothetical protein
MQFTTNVRRSGIPLLSLVLLIAPSPLAQPRPTASDPAPARPAAAAAEQPSRAMIPGTFPELEDFHRHLLTIWYGPLREENWQEVRQACSGLVDAKNKLLAVQVPESLRDRATAYAAKRDLLDQAVEQFAVVCMWEADEKIAPAMQEVYDTYYPIAEALGLEAMTFPAAVDAFGAVLRAISQEEIPEGDRERIRRSLPLLRERLDVVKRTAIPSDLEEERALLADRLEQLDVALVALEATSEKGEKGDIEQAFDMFHGAFKAVAEMLHASGEPASPE